jgi:hypothetical protein
MVSAAGACAWGGKAQVVFPRFLLDDLLSSAVVSPNGKLIYLVIREFGPNSLEELSSKSGLSWKLVARECRNLVRLGWVSLVRSGKRLRPLALIPEACQRKMVQAFGAEFGLAANKGEFLMKCCLDLWLKSEEFVDNARPAFLENPKTSMPLEYDRYHYLDKVAFEFNGPQHSETTEQFSSEKDLAERIQRDLAKEALSIRNGVTLVVVTAQDLNPATFSRLLPESLEQNHVVQEGPYFEVLSNTCATYRATARQAKTVKAVKPSTKV